MLFIKSQAKNNNFMNILTASRLFTFVHEGTMYKISTACFIYRSIFAIQALRKRRVQGHCAAYHFRILFTAALCTDSPTCNFWLFTMLNVSTLSLHTV